MDTPSSMDIIANLTKKVEGLFSSLFGILNKEVTLKNSEDFCNLESQIHQLTAQLADTLTGVKLQEHLVKSETIETNKDFVKSQPHRIKNMGVRSINIRMLGGNIIRIASNYYHRKATEKKYQGRRGFYPGLLLLGVADRQTPALESLISLLATASSSFNEASELIQHTMGFSVDVKIVRNTVKRFSEKVRSSAELDNFNFPDNFSGRIVGASTDGGRIRVRKNKRGHKTKKQRTRYKTDWREPKLIIIYVIGVGGKKERRSLPVMDATLNGPDETFAMLIFYLKKLKVDAADLLLFLSDGAKWIWDRAKNLISQLGISSDRCLFALDYYHAVEHLSDLASLKRWDASAKKKWVNLQKKRLIEGRLDKFFEEIEAVCKGSKNKKVLRERAYFKKHLPHMKYSELKSQGLPIGSGAVESAIRRVINLRLKGPGIFWHEDTAEGMLMLRAYYKSGRWNTLQKMAYAGGMDMS